jgi:hypothetical protein
MLELFPDPEDDGAHPMTAAGVVLLAAAALGTTAVDVLVRFTNYGSAFVSAIANNMQQNRLWVDGKYDCSTWLSADGIITTAELWEHVQFGCGEMCLPEVDDNSIMHACSVYCSWPK